MDIASSYLEAAIPEPRRILGLLLRPFCLGHYLTLRRLDSGFVDDKPREISKEDVIVTSLVCHFTYEAFWEWMRQKDCYKQMTRWGKKIGLFSIKEKAAMLQDYIKEAQKLPGISFKEDGQPSKAHWSHNLLVTLTSHCGMTRSEAMNAPLQQAFYDMLKYAESNGVVTFLSEQELETIRTLEEANRG